MMLSLIQGVHPHLPIPLILTRIQNKKAIGQPKERWFGKYIFAPSTQSTKNDKGTNKLLFLYLISVIDLNKWGISSDSVVSSSKSGARTKIFKGVPFLAAGEDGSL